MPGSVPESTGVARGCRRRRRGRGFLLPRRVLYDGRLYAVKNAISTGRRHRCAPAGNRDRENLVQAITKLRIATRKSQLALWQAEHVRDRLMAFHPGLEVELVAMSTRGDKILDTPLAKM